MTLPMLTQFMATPPATHSRLAPVTDRARRARWAMTCSVRSWIAAARSAWTWVMSSAGSRAGQVAAMNAGVTRGQPDRSTRSGNNDGSSANPDGVSGIARASRSRNRAGSPSAARAITVPSSSPRRHPRWAVTAP